MSGCPFKGNIVLPGLIIPEPNFPVYFPSLFEPDCLYPQEETSKLYYLHDDIIQKGHELFLKQQYFEALAIYFQSFQYIPQNLLKDQRQFSEQSVQKDTQQIKFKKFDNTNHNQQNKDQLNQKQQDSKDQEFIETMLFWTYYYISQVYIQLYNFELAQLYNNKLLALKKNVLTIFQSYLILGINLKNSSEILEKTLLQMSQLEKFTLDDQMFKNSFMVKCLNLENHQKIFSKFISQTRNVIIQKNNWISQIQRQNYFMFQESDLEIDDVKNIYIEIQQQLKIITNFHYPNQKQIDLIVQRQQHMEEKLYHLEMIMDSDYKNKKSYVLQEYSGNQIYSELQIDFYILDEALKSFFSKKDIQLPQEKAIFSHLSLYNLISQAILITIFIYIVNSLTSLL